MKSLIYSIRKFRENDAQAISIMVSICLQKINAPFYPEHVIQHICAYYSPKKICELAHSRFFLVAESDERIIGSGTLAYQSLHLGSLASDSIGEIGLLFVHPDVHHQGVATQLMSQLEDFARRSHVSQLQLNASLNSVGFYEQYGYIRLKSVVNGKFGKTILCKKILNP